MIVAVIDQVVAVGVPGLFAVLGQFDQPVEHGPFFDLLVEERAVAGHAQVLIDSPGESVRAVRVERSGAFTANRLDGEMLGERRAQQCDGHGAHALGIEQRERHGGVSEVPCVRVQAARIEPQCRIPRIEQKRAGNAPARVKELQRGLMIEPHDAWIGMAQCRQPREERVDIGLHSVKCRGGSARGIAQHFAARGQCAFGRRAGGEYQVDSCFFRRTHADRTFDAGRVTRGERRGTGHGESHGSVRVCVQHNAGLFDAPRRGIAAELRAKRPFLRPADGWLLSRDDGELAVRVRRVAQRSAQHEALRCAQRHLFHLKP